MIGFLKITFMLIRSVTDGQSLEKFILGFYFVYKLLRLLAVLHCHCAFQCQLCAHELDWKEFAVGTDASDRCCAPWPDIVCKVNFLCQRGENRLDWRIVSLMRLFCLLLSTHWLSSGGAGKGLILISQLFAQLLYSVRSQTDKTHSIYTHCPPVTVSQEEQGKLVTLSRHIPTILQLFWHCTLASIYLLFTPYPVSPGYWVWSRLVAFFLTWLLR